MKKSLQMGRAFLGLLAVCPALAAIGGGYDLTWNTLDGGGDAASGGNFALTGTIGQPDANTANVMTGAQFSLTGGFWGMTLPLCTTFVAPDFDHDCDVDAVDFNAMKSCASGAGVPLAIGCETKDLDGDHDVDMDDFGIFQRCYSGAANPPPAGCGH